MVKLGLSTLYLTSMNPIDQQFTVFNSLVKSDNKPEFKNYITDFPYHDLSKTITAEVPIFFHRQWLKASLKGHLRTVKKLERHRQRTGQIDPELVRHAEAWLGQAKQLLHYVLFFKSLDHDSLQNYRIPKEHLRHGDIVVSYKTRAYLKKNILSRLVKFFSYSPVTHAMFVSHSETGEPEFLVSGDTTKGLGIIAATTTPGDILLILQPNPHLVPQLHTELEKWRVRASQPEANKLYPFPELKCQTASGIGLISIIFTFLAQPLCLRNPLAKRAGLFCSEFVDTVFHRAGLLLTPRSINPAIIGPIEVFYSHHLTLRGVYCHDSDVANLDEEISDQFKNS